MDNNIAVRSLRRAILTRKKSLFYRDAIGARMGDLCTNLIHTYEISQLNPYDYVVARMSHGKDVATNPHAWLSWNHRLRRATPDMPATSPAVEAAR